MMKRSNIDATQLLDEARANMLYNLPFFGTLALELKLIEDNSIHGSCTDGEVIKFNGNHIKEMVYETREYLIAHEVLHCAFGHHARRGDREPKRWNRACDLVVDHILINSGFKLPAERMHDYIDINRIGNNTAEKVYDLIKGEEGDGPGRGRSPEPNPEGSGNGGKSTHRPEGDEPSDGQSGGRPGDGFGEVIDPEGTDAPSDIKENIKDWEGKVSKAASIAKRIGKGSMSLEAVLNQIKKQHEISWKEQLRDFVERVTKGDYSWTQPNKRYLTTCGIYLPALHSRELGKIVVAIDTSGSIATKELNAFEAELNAIFNEFPAHVIVMYCDSKVKKEDEYRAGDIIKFHPVGGGGTDFTPVFNRVSEAHQDAECVVYFTDTYGNYPKEFDKPTLWIATEECQPGSRYYPPFGKVIELKLHNE